LKVKIKIKICIDSGNFDFSSVFLACACVALARKMIKLKERWPKIFEDTYQIKFSDFKDCYEFVKK